jgi:HSP20 family protein
VILRRSAEFAGRIFLVRAARISSRIDVPQQPKEETMKSLTTVKHRLSPWQELETLQERLERILGGTWPTFTDGGAGEWTPAVDFKETDKEFVLTAELPGMAENDVDVEVEQNILTIKGEKRTEREEKKEKDGQYHLVERSYGFFQRAFTLPPAVDAAKIQADFSNGVLTVRLPKRQESTARRIAVGSKK